jgi:hypothetical protein
MEVVTLEKRRNKMKQIHTNKFKLGQLAQNDRTGTTVEVGYITGIKYESMNGEEMYRYRLSGHSDLWHSEPNLTELVINNHSGTNNIKE